MLAEILAQLAPFLDPSLGIQSLGAGVLLYSLRRLSRIERDIAVIKDRLGIPTRDSDTDP